LTADADTGHWNHNIHYHRLIRSALGPGRTRVLDVGCGEGILARELRAAGARVTGIDRDATSIELARRQGPAGIDYIRGEFMSHPFEVESFDAITSVAALHHLDAEAALRRMRHLLRPGGRLVVVGCARSELPADALWEVAGALAHRWHVRLRRRPLWEHSAPQVWPPQMTYRQMRRIARQVLPGARWRRRALWRYSLVWTKPPPR
jgi:SAM-dependent methyltransferase